MSLSEKSAEELALIAGSGGGLDFDASAFSANDLAIIAGAAKESGARVTLRGIGHRSAEALCIIGYAGGGCVQFAD